MGWKYVHEFDELLERYPDVMGAAEVAVIKEIAFRSQEPDSKEHEGGRPRVSNGETLWPGEMYMTRERFGAHVGLGANAVGDVIAQLKDAGLPLRLREGKRGKATVYKYPGKDKLTAFMATRPKRRRKKHPD